MKHFDAWGAITVTASLMLLVFGLTQSTNVGWGSGQTIGVLAGSGVLMAIFLAIEQRSRSPLVPLGIFRRRTLSGANLIGFGLGTMVFGMFFLLSLYMQQVLGFSAMETGVASGLINTSQQIGGALGLAILATVANTRTEGLLESGTPAPEALTSGFQIAFWVGAAFALISLVTTLIVLRSDDLRAPQPAPAPAA